MIKAIVFDCFGVLTSDSWKEFCSTLPNEEVVKTARNLNHMYDAGHITQREFIDELVRITNCPIGQIEQIFTDDMPKNTQLLSYIKVLKPNYKIGLLSNVASNWINDNLLNKEEQALFDEMVFSFEVGMTKPDPQIFEITCQKLAVKPAEAVMIDDIERYCEAAKSIGMQAIVYSDFHQLKHDLGEVLSHS